MRRFLPIAFLCCTLAPAESPAQPNSRSGVEVGTVTTSVMETEAQVQQGLPQFLRGIQDSVDALNKNDWAASKSSLDQVRKTYSSVMDALRRIEGDEERELSFQKIGQALDQANYALDARRKKEALADLSQAYRLSKALAGSPILKLTATKVSLYMADQQIRSKNYSLAGNYLERAIDNVTSLENDKSVDQKEMRSLKNAIVIAHQQVVLGKQDQGGYMSNLYERATAATSNALYQYYDMWTRTPVPWEANE